METRSKTPEPEGVDASTDRIAQLVEQLRAGDDRALADLFACYQDRFLRLIELRLHPNLHARIDSHDVLQEAYIDASQRLQNFFSRKNATIGVWLRLIILQRLQLMVRHHLLTSKRDARKEISLGAENRSEQKQPQDWLCDSLTSPSELYVRRESASIVESLMSKMSDTDREVLLLRHFEQLTNEEVAEVLGISIKAASNRYVRALERLKSAVRIGDDSMGRL